MAGRKKVVKVETFEGLDIFVAEESVNSAKTRQQKEEIPPTSAEVKVNPGTEVHRLSLEEEGNK